MTTSSHERLKQSLHSTPGMLLLSSSGSTSSSQHQVLHRARGAALNFHSTIAWLRSGSSSSIARTSSTPAAGLFHQLGATRFPSTDSLPSIAPPVEEEEGDAEADPPLDLLAEEQAAAVIRIQALYRGYRVRSSAVLQRSSVVKMQAAWRMWSARRKLTRMRDAVEKIQRSYRAWKQARLLLEQRRAAAVLIQSHARGGLVRRRTLQEKQRRAEAASRIQALFRGRVSRRQYLSMKRSARTIEEAYSMYKFSRNREAAARVIQKFVRKRRKSLERAANSQQAVSVSVSATLVEDWNNVEVEHLDQCLDTCLATLHPQRPPLQLPAACSREYKEEQPKQSSLDEKKLQQVARVFLLQHHIALQQQHAKKAPPFPPNTQNRYTIPLDTYRSTNTHTSNIVTNTNPRTSTGDVVLDVQYLIEEARKLGASSDPVLYMQNDDSLGLDFARQEIAEFRQINAFLVVIVAVVIYTRSICQEVLVWAKQSTRR